MRRNDRDHLQHIMDELLERLLTAVIERKQVTLPEPIRTPSGSPESH